MSIQYSSTILWPSLQAQADSKRWYSRSSQVFIVFPHIAHPRLEHPRIAHPRIAHPRIAHPRIAHPYIVHPRIECLCIVCLLGHLITRQEYWHNTYKYLAITHFFQGIFSILFSMHGIISKTCCVRTCCNILDTQYISLKLYVYGVKT